MPVAVSRCHQAWPWRSGRKDGETWERNSLKLKKKTLIVMKQTIIYESYPLYKNNCMGILAKKWFIIIIYETGNPTLHGSKTMMASARAIRSRYELVQTLACYVFSHYLLTNAILLSIGPSETHINEIHSKLNDLRSEFFFKLSCAKCWIFCSGAVSV